MSDVSLDGQSRTDALRELDAELQMSIERLEKARADIAVILRDNLPADLNRLPPDADEDTRQRLADTLARHLTQKLLDYPWMQNPAEHLPQNSVPAAQTMVEAMHALYNPAQLDVLGRAHLIATEMVGVK